MAKLNFFIVTTSILIVFYLSWVFVLALKYNTKYTYKTNENTFLIKVGTYLIQPIMEVFGNGKVTHFWHWQNLFRIMIISHLDIG